MRTLPILLACAAIALIPACKDESKTKRGEGSTRNSSATIAAEITEEDRAAAMAFGQRIEDAVKSGDEEFLLSIFDFNRIVEGSFSDIDIPSEFKRGMKSGMKKAGKNAVATILSSDVKLIEFRPVRGKPGLLFRFRPGEGFDYIEYQITRTGRKDPEWVISDAYTYSVGTYVSDLLRSMMIPALAEHDRSLLDKLLSRTKDHHLESLPKVGEMMTLSRLGDPDSARKALRIWDSLPAEIKAEKFPMFVHIMAQSCLIEESDAETESPYLKAIDDYEKAFPGDPALALMSIDQNFLREDYAAARQSIKDLGKEIPDPYLDFYAGYIDLVEEKYDDCENAARTFLKIEPGDQEACDLLLEAGHASENHELTAEALTILEQDLGMDYGGAMTADEFKKFRESEAGKSWMDNRGDQ